MIFRNNFSYYLNYETDIPDISSTIIRNAIKSGQQSEILTEFIDPQVLAYIKEKNLYL